MTVQGQRKSEGRGSAMVSAVCSALEGRAQGRYARVCRVTQSAGIGGNRGRDKCGEQSAVSVLHELWLVQRKSDYKRAARAIDARMQSDDRARGGAD